MKKTNKIIIDAPKPFSQSCLWNLQRYYFDTQGIQAWSGAIPFYVTNNPFIANSYAEIVMGFIQDWIAQHPTAIHSPFYVLELGTGPGQFGFYFLKRIIELRDSLQLQSLQLRYIMSDFTKENIIFLQQHPALKPLIESKMLDFALFNMETDSLIHCLQSKTDLTATDFVNPLCVIANYLFDCISHDCFSIADGKLYESLVSVSTTSDNLKGDEILDLNKINKEHQAKEIQGGAYYPENEFNAILKSYTQKLMDTHLLFPIAALRAIANLRKLSDKLLLLVSDKAYTHLQDLDHLQHPHLEVHQGCFSVMVNLHAIAEYFYLSDGDAYLQTPREGIKTAAFISGLTFKNLPQLRLKLTQYIEGVSPADYLNLYHHIIAAADKADIKILGSYLNLSQWDPYLFHHLRTHIDGKIRLADYQSKGYFTVNLQNIAEHFYYLPASHDTYFDIALLYHAMGNYANALQYYQLSAEFFEEQFELYYNRGLCHYYLGTNQKAFEDFQAALALQPDSIEAQEWLSKLK